MENKGLVSVVIPVYNVQKYLECCIDSILNQTYKEVEIILVDDGSKDESGAICDRYGEKYENVRVYHRENAGVSASRNFGTEISKGKYIAFVDSDDYVEPGYIEKLLNAIVSNNTEIALCNYNKVNDDNEVIHELDVVKDEVLDAKEILKKCAEEHGFSYIVCWARLYSVELAKKVPFRTGKVCEDEFMAFDLFKNSKRIACISDRLYDYRKNSSSITSRNTSISLADCLEATYERFKAVEKEGWEDCIPAAYKCGRDAFEKLKTIKPRNAKERERYKETVEMFRYMLKKGKASAGFTDRLVAVAPKLYFGMKRMLGK
ncbi:MAG: glycosyltransferase [Lachnospiraceae bacterium]|nr:glycosyltransferase [Lachnospiraceae bacterium]